MEAKYDYKRSVLNEDEKKRIKALLDDAIQGIDGFERNFLRFFKGEGKSPTTNLGRAWVNFGCYLGHNPNIKNYKYYNLDKHGFDQRGIHASTGTYRDSDGFDASGKDVEGYKRDGFDNIGYDRNGYNRNGIHRSNDPEWILSREQQKKASSGTFGVSKTKAMELGLYSIYSNTDGQD